MDQRTEIRLRMVDGDVTQRQVSVEMGVSESTLSMWIIGRHPMPEGTKERIFAAIDKIAKANRAAEEARQRVLAEGDL